MHNMLSHGRAKESKRVKSPLSVIFYWFWSFLLNQVVLTATYIYESLTPPTSIPPKIINSASSSMSIMINFWNDFEGYLQLLFRKCWPNRKLAAAAFSQMLRGGAADNHQPPKPLPQTLHYPEVEKMGSKWSTLTSHFSAHFCTWGAKFLTELSEDSNNLKELKNR